MTRVLWCEYIVGHRERQIEGHEYPFCDRCGYWWATDRSLFYWIKWCWRRIKSRFTGPTVIYLPGDDDALHP